MTDTGELSDLVRIDRTRWVGAQRRIHTGVASGIMTR